MVTRIQWACGALRRIDNPDAGRSSSLSVDDRRSPVRTVVYEIAPLDGTTEVPAISLAFFDPGPPAGYRVVRTNPIPLARPIPTPAATPLDGAFPWPWALALLRLGLARSGQVVGQDDPALGPR